MVAGITPAEDCHLCKCLTEEACDEQLRQVCLTGVGATSRLFQGMFALRRDEDGY